MANQKAIPAIDPDKLALYDKIMSAYPEVERKGVTLPYTAVNGNMFTFMSAESELSIRLPKKELAEFIQEYDTRLSVQHGVAMKEYAIVPASLLKKPKELKKYLDISLAYIKTLKPRLRK